MSYYPTLAEDIERAKAILARGKHEFDEKLADILPGLGNEHLAQIKTLVGGTIYGGDIYAAYRLLESFVEAIECIGVDVVKTALRAQQLAASHACVCRTRSCGHPAADHDAVWCRLCNKACWQ